jgi:hypothetical protein
MNVSEKERLRRWKLWRNALEKKIRRRTRNPGRTAPPLPKSNTTIWRYMSRRVFMRLLTERRLMFHRFDELQKIEAREGMVANDFWRSIWEHLQARLPFPADLGITTQMAEARLDRLRCLIYASCWNMGKHENNLMWKAYAPEGIAIRTSVGKLKNAPQAGGTERLTIEYQKIVYADNWRGLEQRGYRSPNRGVVLVGQAVDTVKVAIVPKGTTSSSMLRRSGIRAPGGNGKLRRVRCHAFGHDWL